MVQKVINIQSSLGAIVLVGVSGILCGCSNPSQEIIGHWAVDTSQPKMAQIKKAGVFGAMALNNVNVDFRKDKTFTLTIFLPITGTYTVNGHEVTLHPTRLLGIVPTSTDQNQKPHDIVGTLSSDGKRLVLDPNGKSPGYFVKQNS